MGWPFDQPLDEQEDVVEEILSWLPPKSLLRFMSVNKSWHQRITSLSNHPRFVLRQVSNAYNRADQSPATSLIFRRGRTLHAYRSFDHDRPISLLKVFPGGGFVCRDLDLLPPRRSDEPSFNSGSVWACHHCNGLLCLVDGSGMILVWNPATRQRRLVPARVEDSTMAAQGIGFGCDSGGKEYKIVVMHCKFEAGEVGGPDLRRRGRWVPAAEVFSLSEGSWRSTVRCRSDQMPDNLHWGLGEDGVYCDGACYWLVRGLGPQNVLRFDVGREEFCAVELPPLPPECRRRSGGGGLELRWGMSAWKGQVAVFSSYDRPGESPGTRCMDVWLMSSGGSGWRKCFSFGPFDREILRSPLALLNGGWVLMAGEDGKFWVCDVRTESVVELRTHRDDCMSYWGLYVETVASVF